LLWLLDFTVLGSLYEFGSMETDVTEERQQAHMLLGPDRRVSPVLLHDPVTERNREVTRLEPIG
jgi:hypothetical protein